MVYSASIAVTERAEHPSVDFTTTFDVRIDTGSDQRTFTLHANGFIPRSNFFKAALSEAWSNKSTPIDLAHVKIPTFNAYLQCVYFSAISHPEDYDDMEKNRAMMGELSSVYLLADELGDLTSTNLIIDGIEKRCTTYNTHLSPEDMARIYAHTAYGNPLRVFLIKQCLRERGGMDDGIDAEQYPTALLADIYAEYRWRRAERMDSKLYLETLLDCPTAGDICHHHQHNSEHPECAGRIEKEEW